MINYRTCDSTNWWYITAFPRRQTTSTSHHNQTLHPHAFHMSRSQNISQLTVTPKLTSPRSCVIFPPVHTSKPSTSTSSERAETMRLSTPNPTHNNSQIRGATRRKSDDGFSLCRHLHRWADSQATLLGSPRFSDWSCILCMTPLLFFYSIFCPSNTIFTWKLIPWNNPPWHHGLGIQHSPKFLLDSTLECRNEGMQIWDKDGDIVPWTNHYAECFFLQFKASISIILDEIIAYGITE